MVSVFVGILFLCQLGFAQSGSPFRDKFPEAPEEPPQEEIVPQEQRINPEVVKKLLIQGVFWGGGFPQAIIAGEIYKEGDKLKNIDAEVAFINEGKVKIRYGGRLFTLFPIDKIKSKK